MEIVQFADRASGMELTLIPLNEDTGRKKGQVIIARI
jgi:hypothetical protein